MHRRAPTGQLYLQQHKRIVGGHARLTPPRTNAAQMLKLFRESSGKPWSLHFWIMSWRSL